MRVNRRRHATTVPVVLAMLVGSLWAGVLAAPAAGDPAGQLAAGRSLPAIGPAVPPDRTPALRQSGERPDLGPRLVPLLLGLLAAALGIASAAGMGRPMPGLARARSLVRRGRAEARAPPFLQPA